ncbi:hypothetical protein [Thauera sp. WB-2]|uniref:hypothetical protein n=1 Tax=Thauera sp. WB-2 TaxID=2897772 RepID=UPI0022DD5876|nr:hypothetical protein [Thauera sp. WB-2]WBL65809.1 hypothetical protein LQF09_08415 [Thauera sp. WB-2]
MRLPDEQSDAPRTDLDRRMQRLGGRLAILARALIALVVLVPLLRWWWPHGRDLLPAVLGGSVDMAALGWSQRVTGSAIDCAIAALGVAALLTLGRLGDLFRCGAYLSGQAATLMGLLGRQLLWLAGAQIAYAPLMSLGVTLLNPPGQRMLTVTVTGTEAMLLIGALVTLLFARITEEAVRIADENAQII